MTTITRDSLQKNVDGIIRDAALVERGARSDQFQFGKYCHECKQLDFLSDTCEHCNRTFCHAHFLEHSTDLNCPVFAQKEKERLEREGKEELKSKSVKKKKKGPRCNHEGCKKSLTYLSIQCKDCGQNFCLSHKFADDHNCTGKLKSRLTGQCMTHPGQRLSNLLSRTALVH